MSGMFWDDPADNSPGVSNHVELTGPDANGNEWAPGLYGRSAGHMPPVEMVGDVGLDRRTMP